MDYNFWDDRTHELEINPCEGCEDYQNGECISNGGCASVKDEQEVKEMEEKIIALDRVSNGKEYGDLVQCNNCGRVMLVNLGEETCPECDAEGSFEWVDDKQEYSIYDNSLLLVDVE